MMSSRFKLQVLLWSYRALGTTQHLNISLSEVPICPDNLDSCNANVCVCTLQYTLNNRLITNGH
uniref:Uncharacterized protein n=1 Tax=Anguilla anguilla TaxID=7936 RepID=A0A0E9XHP7_ANGAN